MSAPPPVNRDRTVFIVLGLLLAFVAGTLFGIILSETTRPTVTFSLPPFEDPEDPPCVTAPCIPPPAPDTTIPPPVLPPPCAHPDPQPFHGRDPWCHRA